MMIIEGMKEIKRLQVKAADLRLLIARHSADMDIETPPYPDQKSQVTDWIQSHQHTMQRIEDLRLAIQRTNLATEVSIELDGRHVKKSIAGWVHWRRDLSQASMEMYMQLQDRNSAGQPLRDGAMQSSSGQAVAIKIRRYYDPALRDRMIAMYKAEPSVIDGHLDVVNATTPLMLEA